MPKKLTKSSKISFNKKEFDKIFEKVAKESPKEAVEIEKHEFKSPRIQAVVDKTQTAILEIPNEVSKARLSYLEKQFE